MNRISENSNKDTNYTNSIPKTEYFSACYSLIEDAQYNCMLINKNKNQAFVEWLYTFSKEHIKSISLTPKKQYEITCTEYQTGKFFMKFARVSHKTVTQKIEDDFVSGPVTDYPNCKIFIDTEHQIMIIEKNLEVAPNISKIKDLIAKVISNDICSFGYTLYIELVTKVMDFWSYVNENKKKLESIEFTLVYPNFLEGYDTVKDFTSAFVEYNPQIITTKIENKEGHLQLPENRTFINDALSYASSGAGSWKATAKGAKKLKSSESVPNMHELPYDISELRSDQLEHINDIFNSILEISNENRTIGDENESQNENPNKK